MDRWKRAVLQGYYWGAYPWRWRDARRRAHSGQEPVRVVFYHRVADTCRNGWTMDTRTFVRQINWLSRHYDVVSLAEAQQRIASGNNRRPTACITFDDGYHDNCQTAIPLLIDRRIPFTYFVSTTHVIEGKPFAHDVAEGQPLRPNSLADLEEMVRAGVEIGAHTRTHADLGSVSAAQVEEEIIGSQQDLVDALEIEVRYFAFPYGLPNNMSTEAFRVAAGSGLEGVCSAYGGYNFPGDDPFHIRRFHGDPEMVRFRNWLAVDRRKLARHPDFLPGDYRRGVPAHEHPPLCRQD